MEELKEASAIVPPERAEIDYNTFVKAAQEVGLVCLHRHFEGTFTLSHLRELSQEISRDLDVDLKLKDETWDSISKIMAGTGERDLPSFIARLSTRWLRLMLIKGVMDGADGHEIIKKYADHFLQLADDEGIKTIEFLLSPFAFCKEGDLGIDYIDDLPKNAPEEEKEIIEQWKLRSAEIDQDNIPTLFSLCGAVNDLIKEKYRVINEDFSDDKRMGVGFRLCLRREKKAEEFLTTEIEETAKRFGGDRSELISQIVELYKAEVIQGVDIAGVESSKDLFLYNKLFTRLDQYGIPCTVHVAEMPESEAEKAYKNLETAIVNSRALRLGHAVRLFDDNAEINALLLQVLKSRTLIECNVTSNGWTGCAPNDLAEHPIIRALRRDHSLFKNNPDRIKELWDCIVICSDDPVIFTSEKESKAFLPLIDEHYKILCVVVPTVYPEKLEAIQRGDENALKEIFTELKTKGEQATLANIK